MSKKRPVFMLLKIVSFSNDIVSPINLNIAIIINDHLSIESALKFTVIIFFHSAPTLSLEIYKKGLLLHVLPLSLGLLTARSRALPAGLLLSDMYARVKSKPLPPSIPVQKNNN